MTPLTVIAPDFFGYFTVHFLEHLRHCAPRLVSRPATHSPTRQRQVLSQSLKDKSTALVCVSLRPPDDVISAYRAAGIPVILIDERANGAASILVDNQEGARLAARHLLDLGHQEITLLTGATKDLNAIQRDLGFCEALQSAGYMPIRRLQAPQYSAREGERLFDQIAGTAVFCAAGDDCAIGIMKAARDHRVSIPHDLSLVGYDDAPVGQIVTPSLTTISQPLREMAVAAYRMAVQDHERALSDPETITFPPELIIRGSAVRRRST
jgi:DNA-binding LacI/PurR family transcriptional regulator